MRLSEILILVLLLPTAACSPALDAGRMPDLRQAGRLLAAGPVDRDRVVGLFGWPDRMSWTDPAVWWHDIDCRGVPAGTVEVWSYFRTEITGAGILDSRSFQGTWRLLRIYFGADGTVLGWSTTGSGGVLLSDARD